MQVAVVLVVVAAVAVGGYFLVRRGRANGPGPESLPPEPTVPEKPAGNPAGDPGAKPVAARPVAEQPGPAPAPSAALAEADKLYASAFADPKNQDRTQWERLRALYGAALEGLPEPAARKPVVDKLNELNKFLICSSMKTADCVFHKADIGESIERIAMIYNLPRDCSGSVSRINKTEKVNIGQTFKVIKPLKMEIRVSKKYLRLTATLNGYFFGEFPVGIGKDDATPAGEFVIKADGKDKKPTWWKTTEDGRKVAIKFGEPGHILGTRWMGLEEKEGAVGLGIHGTVEKLDKEIPGRISAGCIRMHNPDVELLYDFTPGGSKVTIADQ